MRAPFSFPSLALPSFINLPRPFATITDLESGSGASSPSTQTSTSTCTTTSTRNRTLSRALMKRNSRSQSSSVSSPLGSGGRGDGRARTTSYGSAQAPSLPLLSRTGPIMLGDIGDGVGTGADGGSGGTEQSQSALHGGNKNGNSNTKELKMQSLVPQDREQDLGALVSITQSQPVSLRSPLLDAVKAVAVEPAPRTSSRGFETVREGVALENGNKGQQTGHKAAGCVMFENQRDMSALLQQYDPGKGIEVGKMWPMDEHRKMMRALFLDNILVCAANVQKHGWVLGSENEKFKELHTPERWQMVHEDLMRYTKAVEAYETWRNSFIQTLEFSPSALPPSYGRYGLNLAIIECASRSKDPEELALVNQLSNELIESHANWSQSGSFARHAQDRSDRKLLIRNSVGARIALASFSGLAFIFPMLIMVLDQTIPSRLCTVTIFTFAVGWLLAFWMEDMRSTTIVIMTAAYAAVLMLFVGSGV